MSIAQSAVIHPMALVEEGAEIGEGVKIGPFCTVGPNVKIGARTELRSHVVVTGRTSIGEDCEIFPFASIGEIPQDLKFGGEDSTLVIGDRNRIREGVTMNTGTEGGGGVTKVGDDGLFMANCHVAHDVHIGNRVILVNNASVAGHCILEDNVIVGGLSGVHQFVRIGKGAIIGAVSMVTNDVIPYGLVQAPRGHLHGLATRCCAEVQCFFAIFQIEKLHRQGGGHILHPPVTFLKTRKFADLTIFAQAHGTAGHDFAIQLFSQSGAIAIYHRQIQRGLHRLDLFHRGDHGFGIVICQRFTQPFRQLRRRQAAPFATTFGPDFAQGRVDQAFEMLRAFVFLREGHHGVDNTMSRSPFFADLNRAKAQQNHSLSRGHFAQITAQQAIRAILPAQGGDREPLRAGDFSRVREFRRGQFGQQTPIHKNPAQKRRCCLSCRQSLFCHLLTLCLLPRPVSLYEREEHHKLHEGLRHVRTSGI